jgi:hypothetical protein
MKAGMALAVISILSFAPHGFGAEAVSIGEVPPRMPRNTGLSAYSPPLAFDYANLNVGETYTLRVWLLTPGLWFCASGQWCERQILIDNSSGNNSAGRIFFAQNMDVYDYAQFDWVLRLYDSIGNQVDVAERYVDATTNRAPVLNPIGNRTGIVGEELRFCITSSDPEGGAVHLSVTNLPAGAQFDAALGIFSWTPQASGIYSNILFQATDAGEGPLTDAEVIAITVSRGAAIIAQPQDQVVSQGANAGFVVQAGGTAPISYQWRFNGVAVPNETNATLQLNGVTTNQAGAYRVVVSNIDGTRISAEAALTVVAPRTCRESVNLSIEHLRRVMDEFHNRIPVYDDISSPGNHFHARGQIPDQNAPVTVNGSWTNNPHSGATCIRCDFTGTGDAFGGFYFLNGILLPSNAPPPLLPNAPAPYFGEAVVAGTSIPVTNFTGLNLQGVTALTFWVRGETGGEIIAFFVGGVGRDPMTGNTNQPFPDSMPRHPANLFYQLTNHWQKFTIPLTNQNLTNIMGAFGWVTTALYNPAGAVFYLDDMQFELSPARLEQRLNEPRFLRSFLTKPVQASLNDCNPDNDLDFVFRNTAFLYDNALALEAFLAEGSPDSLRRAKLLGDAMVYAAQNDRTFGDGRLRTAYSAGDIALPPGWEPNGKKSTVPVPGYYVDTGQTFYEVENRDVDTGNNAWAMLALLALYERVGGTNYLEAARRIGDFIQTFRDDTGPYQGFRGGIYFAETAAPGLRTYASTEHNLDIVAAFTRMFRITGEAEWAEGAEHARQFVEAMWDSAKGCYRTGTNESDPETRNEAAGQLPLDTQSWNVLARPEVLTLHPQLLNCAEQNHRNTHDGFSGYDFNEDGDGVWLEGTAQMAVAYAVSHQPSIAEELLGTLRAAQQLPPPFGDGFGVVAASHDGVSSGFGFKLFRRLHVGATAWNVFAQLGFNPYYDIYSRPRLALSRATNSLVISWSTCYADFVLEATDDLTSPHWTALGIQNPAVIPLSGAKRFYRLRQ